MSSTILTCNSSCGVGIRARCELSFLWGFHVVNLGLAGSALFVSIPTVLVYSFGCCYHSLLILQQFMTAAFLSFSSVVWQHIFLMTLCTWKKGFVSSNQYITSQKCLNESFPKSKKAGASMLRTKPKFFLVGNSLCKTAMTNQNSSDQFLSPKLLPDRQSRVRRNP